MLEIERRFQVKTLPDLNFYPRYLIQQGYVSAKPQVRIRRKQEVTGPEYAFPKGAAKITVGFKTPVPGKTDTREEFETIIPESVFFSVFLELAWTLVKIRHCIPATTISGRTDLVWELDIYQEGTCPQGYATVEIEVPDPSVFADIVMPDWIGEEITAVKTKSNLAIAGFDGGFQIDKPVDTVSDLAALITPAIIPESNQSLDQTPSGALPPEAVESNP